MKFMYKKGLAAKDIITGFAGTITYRVDYITGCNQYGLTPQVDNDGKPRDSYQFDESRIEITGKGLLTEKQYKRWLIKMGKKGVSTNEKSTKLGGPQEPAEVEEVH